MKSDIQKIIAESLELKTKMLQDVQLHETLQNLVIEMSQTLKNGRRIYLCGNGGSAADAQHIAAELTGRFYKERPAYAAEALHCNSSYLTAVGNDYGFEEVYSRYIEGIGKPMDVLIGISTSGNSVNVVKALEAGTQKNMLTVGLTGESGGKMLPYCKYWLAVPSKITPRIQEGHILIGHILCEKLEELMINNSH